MLNAGAVAENWRLSTRRVVNVVWSQVYHTDRPPYLCLQHVRRDGTRRASLSAIADPRISYHFIYLLTGSGLGNFTDRKQKTFKNKMIA